MPEYRITAKAGEYVAGRKSTGVGTKMFLTPREAAHDLRNGALEPAQPEASAKTAGKKKGGSSA